VRHPPLAALAVAFVLAVLAGCASARDPSAPPSIALLNQPSFPPGTICDEALRRGPLTLDSVSGLGVSGKPVRWPWHWTAVMLDGRARLFDDQGHLVAVEGDYMQIGGSGVDGPWSMCGDYHVGRYPPLSSTLASGESPSQATPGVPSEPGIGLCQPGEVAIGTVWWTGATAELAGGFTLIDVGSRPCQVGGRPTSLAILDEMGKPLDLDVQQLNPGLDLGLQLLLPDEGSPDPQALFPGQVGVQVEWSNWCGGWTGHGTLVVALPAIGELGGPINDLSAPGCEAPGEPSVILVGEVVSPR